MRPPGDEARRAFVAALEALVGPKTPSVLELIEARVKAMVDDGVGPCAVLLEHWREADTGEMRTGGGDDVGECEFGCPVDDLDRAGLIAVPALKPCTKHGWYGTCPACGGTLENDR